LPKKDSDMNTATAILDVSFDEQNGVLLRLLAIAMDKVQRRRQKPKKRRPLHRV
jgi:hypothetical protein